MFPPEDREIGEADHWGHNSPLRVLPLAYENT